MTIPMPIRAAGGFLTGAGVPLAIYFYIHELAVQWDQPNTWHDWRVVIALAGLLFSAKTVWQWGRDVFACVYKATGYAFLMEGVMITSGNVWLSSGALVFLVGINAIATAWQATREKDPPTPSAVPVESESKQLVLPRAEVVRRRVKVGLT